MGNLYCINMVSWSDVKWSDHQIEQRTTVMYCFVDSWQNSLLLNVAACYQRLNEYVKSIETCNKVGFSSLILFKFVKYSLVLCDIDILQSHLIWVSYKSLTKVISSQSLRMSFCMCSLYVEFCCLCTASLVWCMCNIPSPFGILWNLTLK